MAAKGTKNDTGTCKAIKAAWTSCVNTGRLVLGGVGPPSEDVNAGAGSCMYILLLLDL